MKYLLDIPSCLSKSKALFDKSGKEINALLSTKNHLSIPKGRTSPSLFDGSIEFYWSNVKIVYDYAGYLGSEDFINFLKSEKALKYTIVTKDPEIITICKKYNLKIISLSQLEELIEFDENQYNIALQNKTKYILDVDKTTNLRFGVLIIVFFISLFIILLDKIVGLLSILYIIPISFLISGCLYKVKKINLLIYSIFQFTFALILAFIIYNFENNDFTKISKILSLLSTIFICTKAFENLDHYITNRESKFNKIWTKIF